MVERGLRPSFSAGALAELKALEARGGAARRRREWHPRPHRAALVVDRQRQLARPRPAHGRRAGWPGCGHHPRRRRRCRRAGRAGIGDRRAGAAQHHVGLHRRGHLPDAARAAVHRPHVAQPGPGPAGGGRRDGRGRRRPGRRDRRSTGPASTTTPSSPTTAWPRGSRAPGRCRRRWRPCPAWLRTSACRTRRRSGCGSGATSTARCASRPSAPGRSSTATIVQGLDTERKNRATELIEDFMIAANGETAKFLDAHQFPILHRVVRTPRAMGPHRRPGR